MGNILIHFNYTLIDDNLDNTEMDNGLTGRSDFMCRSENH